VLPEVEQEAGRVGAKRVKRLLEGTMRFKLPYNAYQHAERVRVEMLTGIFETYDLNGDFLDEDGHAVTRIYVESKNVEGAGAQAAEFRRFLAQAYSATRMAITKGGADPKYEFMWGTTCPWKGEGFRRVADWMEVRNAAVWDSERDLEVLVAGRKLQRAVPEDHAVDEDLARVVSKRIWLWVISDRHEGMTMGARMRGWVHERLATEDTS
jgi:hypothetical protein